VVHSYVELFCASRYPLIAQIVDVVRVSSGIAARATRLFEKFPRVRQIVADVWQDEHTTGAWPPLERNRILNVAEQLYSGPSMANVTPASRGYGSRSIAARCCQIDLHAAESVLQIGSSGAARLRSRRLEGVLDRGMKVFHVIGPRYAAAFGMLDSRLRSIDAWPEETLSNRTHDTALGAGSRSREG